MNLLVLHRRRPRLRQLTTAAAIGLLSLPFLLLFSFSTTTTEEQQIPISRACHATRYPSICFTTLSGNQQSTSSSLIVSSISVASNHLSSLTLPSINSIHRSSSNAVANCLDHLSLYSSRLSATGNARASTADARAFISAALIYAYDCWSALKYVNSTVQISSAMEKVDKLVKLTSNALAIVTAVHLSKWAPPATERNGVWAHNSGSRSTAVTTGRFIGDSVPRNLSPNLTVCLRGGRQSSIQSAVNSAPSFSKSRFVIHIKSGVYEEIVRVPFEKTNILFIGDGVGKTVIRNCLNATVPGISTYNTATVGVAGDGFMAAELTFENSAGAGAHQAVAFMSDSDQSVIESVELKGHQDTLYARSMRQLYRSCIISGTVDFIFGNAAAVFDNCTLSVVPRQGRPEKGETNAVTAHGRTDPAQATGFVFHNCVVNGSDEYMALYYKKPKVHRNYLGRPWKEFSRTVFINCYIANIVKPEGWLPWRGEFALQTLYYGEFGNTGPGANVTARVPWSSQIPARHLVEYSIENFIQGHEWLLYYQLL